MPEPTDAIVPSTQPDPRLANLQRVINQEIPMCQQMGVRVDGCDGQVLVMSCPLEQNRNHQGTAFAGSLNALCTIAGWGATHLETELVEPSAVIVIRRSNIKYHRPVSSDRIVARCFLVSDQERAHFGEMLLEKGQSKLELKVEIDHGEVADRPRVAFAGSYVAMLQK